MKERTLFLYEGKRLTIALIWPMQLFVGELYYDGPIYVANVGPVSVNWFPYGIP